MRCKNCYGQDFTQNYQDGPLICTNCGMVNNVEPLPDDEMGDLADMLHSANMLHSAYVNKHRKFSPEMQQMLDELAAEEQRKKDNMSLDEMMGGMRVGGYKRPHRKHKKQ